MSDLLAFLRARVDEDEAAARLAAREGGTWAQDDSVRCPGAISSLGGQVVYDEGAPDENQAPHFARHDPARVLREVEAKRAILGAHGPDPIGKFGSVETPRCLVCLTGREGYEEQWEADLWPCLTLRLLAAVYRDHPDYDEAWKTGEL